MTQSAYITELTQDTTANSFQDDGLLWTWTETKWFTEFDPDNSIVGADGFWLREAYNYIDEIPAQGDPHKKYSDARCISVQLVPDVQETSNGLRAILSFAEPGTQSQGQFDTYQQTQVQNFAQDDTSTQANPNTKATFVEYAPKNGASASGLPPVKFPFMANIQVPFRVGALRISQYNTLPNLEPAQIMDTADEVPGVNKALWNTSEIWGFAAGSLLFIGKRATNLNGTDIYRVEYTFLWNPTGWHHFYAIYVFQNGLSAPDIVLIDPTTVQADDPTVRSKRSDGSAGGEAAFRLLFDVEFDQYFQEIKPPYGKGGQYIPT